MTRAGGFASGTTVPVERTKQTLEALLRRNGATQYGIAHLEKMAVVFFTLEDRQIRLHVPIPAPNDRMSERQREQTTRTRWRCMLLICKAKFELIAMRLSTAQREFLADITLPNGQSVAEWLRPGIEKAYVNGRMPPLLGAGPSKED